MRKGKSRRISISRDSADILSQNDLCGTRRCDVPCASNLIGWTACVVFAVTLFEWLNVVPEREMPLPALYNFPKIFQLDSTKVEPDLCVLVQIQRALL